MAALLPEDPVGLPHTESWGVHPIPSHPTPPPPKGRVGWAWTGGLRQRVSLQRIPLPGKVRSGWGSGTTAITSASGCNVLWQASPVSRLADLVLWSSGSALTSCIMSRTVHHCPCASDAGAQCWTCSTATACG